MTLCNYCNKNISKHITITEHDCKPKRYYELYSPYDNLISTMVHSGYSLLYISNNSINLFGVFISRRNVVASCNRTNTLIPGMKEVANSDKTKNTRLNTIKNRYGDIQNVSQLDISKLRRRETNIAKYGVENQFQRTEVKEQSKRTLVDKYGVENPIFIQGHVHNGRLSKPHKKVSDFLFSIGQYHINDYTGNFKKFNEILQKNYSPIPDIFIPDKNMVIEVYGDRWHMNPSKYTESDTVKLFKGIKTAKECWEYDNIREKHIESFGITVIVIWESHIKHNFDNVKNRLSEILCQ